VRQEQYRTAFDGYFLRAESTTLSLKKLRFPRKYTPQNWDDVMEIQRWLVVVRCVIGMAAMATHRAPNAFSARFSFPFFLIGRFDTSHTLLNAREVYAHYEVNCKEALASFLIHSGACLCVCLCACACVLTFDFVS
jgi:hypothetical protein